MAEPHQTVNLGQGNTAGSNPARSNGLRNPERRTPARLNRRDSRERPAHGSAALVSRFGTKTPDCCGFESRPIHFGGKVTGAQLRSERLTEDLGNSPWLVVQITRARVQCRKNCTALTVGKDRQHGSAAWWEHAGKPEEAVSRAVTEHSGFKSRPIQSSPSGV